MDPIKTLVEQYRAEVNHNNLQITLTGPTKAAIENHLRATLETKGATLKFQDMGQTTLIYASTHKQGTEPIGWIALARVPTHMSIEVMLKNAEEAVAA
jgi:hypothetical protein